MDVDDQPQASKAETLQSLTTGPMASSVSKISNSSRGLPSNKDFHFFYNFDEFRLPVEEISRHSQSTLESIGSSSERLWGKEISMAAFPQDIDEAYDWLVNINDEVFERLDMSLEEFQGNRKKQEESRGGGSSVAEMENDGFQLVVGKKKKGIVSQSRSGSVNGGELSPVSSGGVKVAIKDKKTLGSKPKVPFHIPSIPKPQEVFNILVDNSNQLFEHVWLQRSEDGLRVVHPLEKHSFLDFVDKDIVDIKPVKPAPVECTSFKIVEEVRDLKELAAKLKGVSEFAVDLEHNQYRSFQGITCLIQISTRTEDFIIDALKLRIQIGPFLREVFRDPSKRKVMHGADRDIMWLQRDFGIYICNLFDTGQASRVLKLERNSLEYLLQHFCEVSANKEYQNADWRLRPLPVEMIRYAREDTHYLLHIYDLMRIQLISMPKDSEKSDAPLVEVYNHSYDLCMQLYEKELLTENSYLHVYGLQGTSLNAQQLAIVAGLCEWRDVVARAEDESTGYILPNRSLLEIAKQMPGSTSKLRQLVKSKHPYVERNLGSVLNIIKNSMQNAAAFESSVQLLKEGGRMGTASDENILINEGPEGFLHDTNYPNAKVEGNCIGDTINSNVRALSSASQIVKGSVILGGSASKLDIGVQGGLSGRNVNEKMEAETSYFPFVPSKKNSVSGQSKAESTRVSVSDAAEVSGATVQQQKKPSRAFSALLGNAVPKRKLDCSKKDNDEMKLAQIRSSVSFPIHSFSGEQQMKPIAAIHVPETSHCELPPVSSAQPNLADIIMLESDLVVDDGDSSLPESVAEVDKEDKPMSLSDLSSSFQQCFKPINENSTVRHVERSQDCLGLQVKPFDYEAARKQVKFGDNSKEKIQGEDKGRGGEASMNISVGKKKNLATRRAPKDDGSTELLPPGRRPQAFPTSGNRSATYR